MPSSLGSSLTLQACLTQLLYFRDTYQLEHTATVVSVAHPGAEGGAVTVVTDATVFYPSGGGQPADSGFLTPAATAGDAAASRVAVTDVRLRDGVVYHSIGDAPPPWLTPGAAVVLHVDGPTRALHARIHSAGHLLDVCMASCGYPASMLAPAKGQHSPTESYVEYNGKVPPEDQEPLVGRLNAALVAAVAAGGPVHAGMHTYEAAAELCGGSLPGYIAAGSSPRVVVMAGAPGCPCGGTHVADVAQVGAVRVTGVRVKKGVSRISYAVEP